MDGRLILWIYFVTFVKCLRNEVTDFTITTNPTDNVNVDISDSSVIICEATQKVRFNWTIHAEWAELPKFKIVENTNDEYALFSVLHVMSANNEPGQFTVTCYAENENGVKKSANISLQITDECGTPERRDKYSPVSSCERFNKDRHWLGKCRVHPPEMFEMIDAVDHNGNTTVLLTWKEYEDSLCTDTKLYGFKFTNLRDTSTYFKSSCLITKYDKEKSSNCSTCPQSVYRGNSTYKTALENLGWFTENRMKTDYNVSIQSLPYSTSISKYVKMRQKQVLCQEYTNSHNGTVPKYCFMFGNITFQTISYDASTKHLQVQINWKTKDVNWPSVNTTHICIYIKYKPNLFHKNETSVTVDFTYKDINEVITFARFNKHVKDDVYVESITLNPYAVYVYTEVQSAHSTPPSEHNRTYISVIIVVVGIVLTSLLMVFIIKCWYRRVKKDIHSFLRLNSTRSMESDIFVGTEAEEMVSGESPTVMLVYPHGCTEVEDMVVFLESQLNTFGVQVLCDNLQQERVAKEGLPNVLLDNFNKADYVVMLCVKTEEDVTLSSYQPYMFVRQQLISNSCVYKSDDRNHNRYLAIYFEKTRAHVPAYLIPRAYYLPTQFSSFIQNIFGIQSHFSYLYNKIFEQNVPQIAERKEQLHELTARLNAETHEACSSTTCHKGIRESLETVFQESTTGMKAEDRGSGHLLFPDDSDDDDQYSSTNNNT